MVWRVMKFDPAQQCRRRLYPEHFFEALSQVDVEVIQDQVNLACVGIPAAQHPADEGYEVDLGTPGGDLRDAPLPARLDGDEDIAGTGALVLVILLGQGGELGGQRWARLAQ